MKHLRQYIRRLILSEVYELEAEDLEAYEQEIATNKYGDGGLAATANYRRTIGLQNKEEIEGERAFLQDYQKQINATPEGKAMVRAFQEGKGVVTLHSIGYAGAAENSGKKKRDKSPPTKVYSGWLKSYGANRKDMLSCAAFHGTLESASSIDQGTNWHDNFILNDKCFIMIGYPVLVSKKDVMSQTLGALPQGLVSHQQASGISKRASVDLAKPIYGMKEFKTAKWAGEVLLDNWKPVGTTINLQKMWEGHFEALVKDAISTGLPLHIFDGEKLWGSWKTEDDIDLEKVALLISGGRRTKLFSTS